MEQVTEILRAFSKKYNYIFPDDQWKYLRDEFINLLESQNSEEEDDEDTTYDEDEDIEWQDD